MVVALRWLLTFQERKWLTRVLLSIQMSLLVMSSSLLPVCYANVSSLRELKPLLSSWHSYVPSVAAGTLLFVIIVFCFIEMGSIWDEGAPSRATGSTDRCGLVLFKHFAIVATISCFAVGVAFLVESLFFPDLLRARLDTINWETELDYPEVVESLNKLQYRFGCCIPGPVRTWTCVEERQCTEALWDFVHWRYNLLGGMFLVLSVTFGLCGLLRRFLETASWLAVWHHLDLMSPFAFGFVHQFGTTVQTPYERLFRASRPKL